MPDDIDKEYEAFLAAKSGMGDSSTDPIDREYAEFVKSRAPAAPPIDNSPWPRRYRVTRPAALDGHGGGSQFSEERDFASQEEFDAYMKRGQAPAPVGAASHLGMGEKDYSGKPPVLSGLDSPQFRDPATGKLRPLEHEPMSVGRVAKEAAGFAGELVVTGLDTFWGSAQDLIERGVEHLPIGGKGARVKDLSREGLTWEERKRSLTPERMELRGDKPRPITDTVDALAKVVGGPDAPGLDDAREYIESTDPDLAAGMRAGRPAGVFTGNTAAMIRGGKAGGGALGKTAVGAALATTKTGRVATHAGLFGTVNAAITPDAPAEAFANGVLASLGGQGATRLAAPWLAKVLTKAGEGGSSLFVKTLHGGIEGIGQSAVPQIHGGEVHSALLEGDAQTVLINVALNTLFGAGAPDVPQGVKIAYIKGRTGEVPPQYRARLDAIAGPVYDAARAVRTEAAKAKAGAKPWTASDEAAARAEIHAGGATGKVAEAQLAKAKRDTYDADLVTPEMLADGKTGTVGDAADAMVGKDRTAFAATSQARIEQGLDPTASLEAGPRETAALEAQEAGAPPPVDRATIDAAPVAPEPVAPDSPVPAPEAPVALVPSRPPVDGEVRPRSVLDAAEKAGYPGAREAREALDALPDSTTRYDPVNQRWTREADIDAAFEAPAAPREEVIQPAAETPTPDLPLVGRNKRGQEVYGSGDKFYTRGPGGRLGAAHPADVKEAQAAAGASGTLLAGTKRKPKPKSSAQIEREAGKQSLSQYVRKMGGIAEGSLGLRGEVEQLAFKNSGTTSLVGRNGRGMNLERMMQSAREAGFNVPEDMDPDKFLENLLADAQGAREFSELTDDYQSEADAAIARMREAEDARWADAPPGAREQYEAEQKARIDAIIAEAMLPRGDDGQVHAGEGESVVGLTREGDPVNGTVVRETDRSIIIDTPEGQKSVPKDKARRDPPGIYLGSGLGGIQPMLESTAPAIKAGAQALGRYSRAFADWVQMRTAPKMTRASPTAGRYAGGIVNSHTTAKMIAPVWLERVFGDAPTAETLAKFGHAAGEWQFNAKRGELEAQLAATTDPVARARIEDRLDRVGTIVGAEGSPFATQTDLDAYMASPEWKAQSEAWRAEWNKANVVDGDGLPGPERMYRDLAKGGDHDPDLFVSDPRDILRINMKPIEPTEDGGTRPVYRTASGSLRAPILKGHAFSREFTGGAEKYDFDPASLIENTYQRVHKEWLKPRLYAELVASGDAQYTNLKDPDWKPPTTIKGHGVARFPISESRTIIKDGKSVTIPGKTLYVRDDLQGELRQTLRTDPAAKQVAPLRVLNTAALTGIADNMWNLMLDSQIPSAAPGHIPGRVGNQLGIANNIVGLLKQLRYTVKRPKDYHERALRLAAEGAWRGERDGQAWTKDYVLGRLADMQNPLKIPGVAFEGVVGGLQKVAQRVHEAGRLVLDDAFTNLVNAGLVENTPVNRREFVNRLGQYAGRAMDRVTEMARDLGVQPFVVAKKKSLAEQGRKLTFSPGAKATSTGAAIEMRVGQLMRTLTVAATIGIINFVNTGSPRGRKGTPTGNIDTGSDDPRTGVPQSWPWLGDITGQGPAARAGGITGFVKAKDEGLSTEQALGDGAMGPVNAVLLKWLSSPAIDFAARLVKGETIPQALGGGGGPKAEPAQPGQNALLNNAGFAARQAAQLAPVATQLADKALGTNISPDYAQDATGEFFDLLKSFAPKRGSSPEILADMKDIRDGKAAGNWAEWAARQRRNFPSSEEWWKWVEKEVGGTNWPERARFYTLRSLSSKRDAR